jgi:diketogulonate reductase-like aldo/keto reductase
MALLEAAFDVAGIRHYDVARYYGYGEAEGVLGKFLSTSNRRDQVTITTKFGLEPPPLSQSSRGKSIMGLVRSLASRQPMLRKILAGVARRTIRASRFDVESARRSLETSLRELRADRIDLLLLHEATLEDTRADGLLEFMEAAKQQGKIRAFGTGTEFRHVPEIVAEAPAFARVLQIANGFGQWNLRQLGVDPERVVITHSALKILPALETAFARLSAVDRAPTGRNEFKSVGDSSLAGLLLGLAMHENPQGVTLFSSVQPERIRDNVTSALRNASLTSAEWSAFKHQAEEALKSTSDVHQS